MKLYELLPKGSLTSNRQSYDSKLFGKKTLSSFEFSIKYPTITIQNNEASSFPTYITIIG